MPCLFLENVPENAHFSPEAIRALHRKISAATGGGTVQVHHGKTQYDLLLADGTTEPAEDVHVFIEWHERPFEVKLEVVAAIEQFLATQMLDSDITFRDSPPGSFFVNGKLVGEKPA